MTTETKSITDLKASRSAIKGWITRKHKDIKILLADFQNGEIVKKKFEVIQELVVDFRCSYDSYHNELTNENDIVESLNYQEAAEKSINEIIQEISAWIAEYDLLNHGLNKEEEPAIQPSDSVSHASSSTSSKRSKSSTVSKATNASILKAKASAKKAVLEAEAAKLKELQDIEEQEFRLKQQKRNLQLKTEIAKAEAEEKALSDVSSIVSGKCPLIPPKSEPIAKDKEDEKSTSSIGSTHLASVNSSVLNEELVKGVIESQRLQADNIKQLLEQQRQHTYALMLPQPAVPTFSGDPKDYCTFVRAFESIIESKTSSERDRLYYLVQYTSGEVQDLVRSCLSMAEKKGYKEARRLVKERFGQAYNIACSNINNVTKGPALKAEDSAALHKFSIALTSCTNTLKEIGYLNKLDNPDSMKRIIERLPYSLRLKWREKVDSISETQKRDVTIDDITKFVTDRARAASHPIFGQVINHESRGLGDQRNKPTKSVQATHQRTSFATQGTRQSKEQTNQVSQTCPLCSNSHWLSRCPSFKGKSVSGRSKFVRENNLCGNCFMAGHFIKNCKKENFCKVEGCMSKHSSFLHPIDGTPVLTKANTNAQQHLTPVRSTSTCNNGYISTNEHVPSKCSKTALAIVPVKIKAKGCDKMVETYAFLDSGSNATFCTEELMNTLGVKGRGTNLSLTTIKDSNRTVKCSIVDLEVLDLEEDNHLDLYGAFSTKDLPVSTSSLADRDDLNMWTHLKDIDIPQINAKVDLLIGCDNPDALKPLDARVGRKGEPYATKTILGWVINGPLNPYESTKYTANAIKADVDLHQQFQDYCNMEFNDSPNSSTTEMSQEDKRALDIMNSSVRLKDGHYELALPWKNDPPCLSNNRSLALHRLLLLKRRLMKDSRLLKMYKEFIQTLFDKGYASKVSLDTFGFSIAIKDRPAPFGYEFHL